VTSGGMAEDRPQLSWVVPMYRTREFLEPLCERAIGVAQALGLSCELVLVDDACPEGTADAAERLQFGCPLRVLRLSQNQGQDAAIRAGLRACAGNWALIIDGDLQDPPEGLNVLWPQAMQGHEAVFADRFGKYQSRGRLLTSRLYRRCLERLGGLPRGAGLFVFEPPPHRGGGGNAVPPHFDPGRHRRCPRSLHQRADRARAACKWAFQLQRWTTMVEGRMVVVADLRRAALIHASMSAPLVWWRHGDCREQAP
jgi:hypothetical protein